MPTRPATTALRRLNGTLPVRGSYPQLRDFVSAVLKDMPVASIDALRFERKRALDTQLDAQVRNRALLSKDVDAISAFAGSSIPSLAAQGVETRFIPYSRYDVPLYGLALITQARRLGQDPALCQAVVEASLEGLAFALKNPEEALEAFGNELKEMAMTKTGMDQIRIGFGMYALTSLQPPARKGLGWQDPEAIKRQTDLVMEFVADKSDKRPPVEKLYTNKFVGGIKLTDAEWAAAEKRFARYAKLVG